MVPMYQWTASMGSAQPVPALEPFYRQAVQTACAVLEQFVAQRRDLPEFSGGRFASPKNATAEQMWNAIEQEMSMVAGVVPTGSAKAGVMTFAVRAAHVVRSGGFGDAGWQRFAATLRYPPRKQPPVEIVTTSGVTTPDDIKTVDLP